MIGNSVIVIQLLHHRSNKGFKADAKSSEDLLKETIFSLVLCPPTTNVISGSFVTVYPRAKG